MTKEEKKIFYCHKIWYPTTRSIINGKLYKLFGRKFIKFFGLKPHYKWKYFNYTIITSYYDNLGFHETIFNSDYRKKIK